MKTTNYETSKKLKEVGFIARAEKCWTRGIDSKLANLSLVPLDYSILASGVEYFLSYDLETLIRVLPENISRDFKHLETGEVRRLKENLTICSEYIGYLSYHGELNYFKHNYDYKEFYCSPRSLWKGEALADAAGRLLALLLEKELINLAVIEKATALADSKNMISKISYNVPLTNYEISKKLKEIGFKAISPFKWDKEKELCYDYNQSSFRDKTDYPAYALETLIDALPSHISLKTGPCRFEMTKSMLYYKNFGPQPLYDGCRHREITLKDENESLADKAARLLIDLWEDKLLKFNLI